jgi:hypothetical protein
LGLAPTTQIGTHSRTQHAILDWRRALARFFNAQALRHKAQKRPSVFLKIVKGNASTKEVVQPPLVPELEFVIEEFWFPCARIAAGELLVGTDARGRTFNFWECALTCDAKFDSDARTERIANAGHLASFMQAQVPGF